MAISKKMLGKKQRISREQAARQQILAAIELFGSENYPCAVTLALAAEGQLPNNLARPYIYKGIGARASDKKVLDKFNDARNWLKHARPESEFSFFELEVIFSIVRAITKFRAVFPSNQCEEMNKFERTNYARLVQEAKSTAANG